jgi:hypothetical protein
MRTVTYLALNVGRGHLMMASVVHRLLAEQGVKVQTFTQGKAGQQFYRRMAGAEAELLSPWFRFSWSNYDLRVGRSVLLVVHYLLNPIGFVADLRHLRKPLKASGLIVNDIHPVGLLLPFFPSEVRHRPLIHILSENSWLALQDIVRSFGWPWACDRLVTTVNQIAFAARHLIFNTLDPSRFFATVRNVTYLPPLLPSLEPGIRSWRQELGLPASKRLFVAYLNPLFRDPELIVALIEASRERDAHLCLVSEHSASELSHLTDRDTTIVPYDLHARSHLVGADLYISGAGLAAPMQAYVAGVPFLGLVSRQPEHAKNAEMIERAGIGHCLRTGRDIGQTMDQALAMDATPHPHLVAATQERWMEIIQSCWS